MENGQTESKKKDEAYWAFRPGEGVATHGAMEEAGKWS